MIPNDAVNDSVGLAFGSAIRIAAGAAIYDALAANVAITVAPPTERPLSLLSAIPNIALITGTVTPNPIKKGPTVFKRENKKEKLGTLVKVVKKSKGNNRIIAEAVNKQDDKGRTPLHIAVKYGKTGAVRALLASGADINKKIEMDIPHSIWQGRKIMQK